MGRLLLKLALVLAVVLSVVPPARADPIASVAVGPGGVSEDEDPYIVGVDVSSPEVKFAPTPAEDDCADGARPASALDTAEAEAFTVQDTVLTIAQEEHVLMYLHELGSTCIAAPLACGPINFGCSYVAYDATKGELYVESSALPPTLTAHQRWWSGGGSFSVTTGVGTRYDCEGCPWP